MKKFWDEAIVPALIEYIRIPAKSPHFDRDWQKNGHIEASRAPCSTGSTIQARA